MRKNVPSQFQDRFRQVSAKVRIANERPLFREFPSQETTLALTELTQFTGIGTGGRFILSQYGLIAGDANVKLCYFELPTGAPGSITRSWFNNGLLMPAGTPISEYHRALSATANQFFAAMNGAIYTTDSVAWTQIIDLTDPDTYISPEISLCAVSATTVAAAVVIAGSDVGDRCKLMVIENGVVDEWKGYLPKHAHRPRIAAVQDSAGTLHLYVDDWSGKKPIHIKRYSAGIWSATSEILPMDALDEDSSFSVAFASKFADGRIFLTGTVKRRYGPAYAVYMLGPDKFTFGRDMIIAASYDKPLWLIENAGRVWAAGEDNIYYTPQVPGIFANITPTTEADVYRFNLEMPANGADRLSLEVPVAELAAHPTDLVAGAMLDLDVTANGQTYALGRFGVDRFRKTTGPEGEQFTIDCSSYALKKLVDWESDTYFDYMGQGESYGDPGDLTKLLRFSGGSFEAPVEGGLMLKSLNDRGMLYTTIPASHGGFIRCKFDNMQAADVQVGVGLNYGEETLAEAAARLGKKVEEVTAAERGRWGLLAVYTPDPYAAPAGKGEIALIDYNTLRKGNLESPDVVYPERLIWYERIDRVPSTLVLAMQYQDGYARVYYAPSDTADLSLIISKETTLMWDIHPTEHENFGRGLVFMSNATGYRMSYPVMSDSDVIPLYDGIAQAVKYNTTDSDRWDKFPASNGTVQVDSEQIFYTGLITDDNLRTGELQWVPGKAVANAGDGLTTPAGTDTTFAQYRGNRVPPDPAPHIHGNNYVLQNLTLSNGTALTAVRVWLKKINFPEDGVQLTINQGNVSSSLNTVTMLHNIKAYGGTVSSSQLKSEGSWVTFYLDRDLIIANNANEQYWIVLSRGKNATHPSSTSYFQFKKMTDDKYSGGGCYLFCEEDDQAVGQSGDMAFVAYAKVDGLNKEYMFPVKRVYGVGMYDAASTYWDANGNPTASQSYWNGCALSISKGQGLNNCFRIVRSFRLTDSLNDLFIFALDRDPGKIFGSDTMAMAVPAFYGLKRGQNSTTATAHGDKSMVSLPRSNFAKASYFEYYTAEEDLTLAEVAENLARKAGVISTDLSNRAASTFAGNTAPLTLEPLSKNLIVTLSGVSLASSGDTVALAFLDDVNNEQMKVTLSLGMNAANALWGYLTISYRNAQGGQTPVLKIPFDQKVRGEFRISLYDGHVSVWCGGRILGAANLGSNLKAFNQYTLYASAGVTAPITAMIPQAGARVDNFVMDMGKSGASLLSNLIGEKRVYFRDNGSGGFRIYTDRESVSGTYNRATSIAAETTDIGLATRVLLEGGEVVEVSSAGNLQKYGNFFKSLNFNEINNLDDAQYYANLVLEDMSLNRERVEVEGYADPRIEPTDIVLLQLADSSTRRIVVDAVSHSMQVDESEAVYDMRLSGRFKE